MTDWLTLHVAALALTAVAFGGMLFFMAGVAPTVFRVLERPQAAELMRGLFPVYYLINGVVLLLAALALAPGAAYGPEVALLAGSGAVFVLLRQALLPRLEARRAAGDQPGFARLHRLGVIVNLLQLVAVVIVFVSLAR